VILGDTAFCVLYARWGSAAYAAMALAAFAGGLFALAARKMTEVR
jgi:hypothetical protein